MNDNQLTDDDLRRQFEAAALATARALGRVTAEYDGAMVIAATLQLLAGKAQQVGVSRDGFLQTVGKAYDAQAGARNGGGHV